MGGEDEEATSSKAAEISHVSIKMPMFYKKSPSTWFKQIESQFVLAGIKSSQTKYHHALAALPEEIACNITIDTNDYEQLKTAVLDSIKANRHVLIEQALGAVTLDDKRPTQLVTEIKKQFIDIGVPVNDEIVKSRLLSALPANVKTALVGHDSVDLEAFAKIADSMLAVAAPMGKEFAISHVDSNRQFSQQSQSSPSNFSNRQFSQQSQPPPSNFSNRRFSNYNNNNSSSHHSRSQVRPFHADQRPKICNAHIFFGKWAKTCRPWCHWPNKPRHMLKNDEKTPHQSRSNSPENS